MTGTPDAGMTEPMGPCPGGAMPRPESCDGTDEDCDGMVDEALSMMCGSTSVAPCRLGQKTCMAGKWSACEGAVEPKVEVCDAERTDDNCNGTVNEGCECTPKQTQACGSMVGACTRGMQTCTASGTWGMCEGGTRPAAEVCDGNIDQDCDGMNDRADSDCQCINGASEGCTAGKGLCMEGNRTCSNGRWGACKAVRAPQKERCDGTQNDEDCDGDPDNGCECVDGMSRECGTDVGECSKGKETCAGGRWGTCTGSVGPASSEACDGKDANCNGKDDVTDRASCPTAAERCIGSGSAAHCEAPVSCGDGQVNGTEPCDPTAGGTMNETWFCSPVEASNPSAGCKVRTVYIPCSPSGVECAAGSSCQQEVSGGGQCLPNSNVGLDGSGTPSQACPKLDGPYTQKFFSNVSCVIECSTPGGGGCPSRISNCIENPFKGAGQYEASNYCAP